MKKFLCIHGHFYQPPRENAWSNEVPIQPSATPFHDWNERITQECYAANAHISNAAITNNLSYLNFNFGPTLLSWMAVNDSSTYQNILAADHESQTIFEGHGSAMAQCYNHVIMPLADARDKRTQVIWGIKDFAYRFKRKPEGMWLPETAVDLESLEIMAEQGITYTVLAPHQASHIREEGGAWQNVTEESLLTTRPYRCQLPSGKSIIILFYDGALANAVAFGDVLNDVDKMKQQFQEKIDHIEEGLVHTVTDGETYGHHRKGGHLILNQFLMTMVASEDVQLTNYSMYLAQTPITHEVRIVENSSWSCSHGIERWQSDCGCCIGQDEQWTQHWRGPLREALQWLKQQLDDFFDSYSKDYGDMWQLRDAYIDEVLLEKTPEDARLAQLLDMQKYAMYMFTSCGWFFDDIARIEPQQVLQYALRAMELAKDVKGINLFDEFYERMAEAKSNCEEAKDGKKLCQEISKNKMVTEHV